MAPAPSHENNTSRCINTSHNNINGSRLLTSLCPVGRMLSEETGKRRHGNLVPMRGCWAGNQNDAVLYQVSGSHCVSSGGGGGGRTLPAATQRFTKTNRDAIIFNVWKHRLCLTALKVNDKSHRSECENDQGQNVRRGSNFLGATDVKTVRQASSHLGKTIVFNPSPGSMAPFGRGQPPNPPFIINLYLTFKLLYNRVR